MRRERAPLQRIRLYRLCLMVCTCGSAWCPGASYMMYWWGWLALIIPITSLMLSETGDSSAITCIFSSTSSARHRRSGKGDVLNESTPGCTAEDVSNSSTTSWEEYTHTGTTEKSTAQQITDLQQTCWANQDSRPYTSLTRGRQCIVRLTGVYPSTSPSTYVGLYCYVATQECVSAKAF